MSRSGRARLAANHFQHLPPKAIDVLLDKAKALGVAIIVRLPLASGLLSGKITRQTTFARPTIVHSIATGRSSTSARPSPACPWKRDSNWSTC